MTEQLLARERRDDLGDHAEGRQDHDVNLGMPEEPEDVLEHDGVATAGCEEETRAEELVGEQHGYGAGQHGHDRDQEISRDQPGEAGANLG